MSRRPRGHRSPTPTHPARDPPERTLRARRPDGRPEPRPGRGNAERPDHRQLARPALIGGSYTFSEIGGSWQRCRRRTANGGEGTVLVAQQAAGPEAAARTETATLGFDPAVPNPARMWNYWLGGKDNYAADRELAARVQEIAPAIPHGARLARRFLGDAVTRLAVEHGIRQFLDIGSGLPTADNTHEVARRAAPDARVVYADHDPVVVTHARALLGAAAEEEGTGVLHADLRDTEAILAGAAATLDLARPVAVLLIAVLHFIPDADDPWAITARLMRPLPSGSFLVIGHGASDITNQSAAEDAVGRYNERASAQITLRTRDQVARFFDGLELIPPGLAPLSQWWPGEPGAAASGSQEAYCGIGRKP